MLCRVGHGMAGRGGSGRGGAGRGSKQRHTTYLAPRNSTPHKSNIKWAISCVSNEVVGRGEKYCRVVLGRRSAAHAKKITLNF